MNINGCVISKAHYSDVLMFRDAYVCCTLMAFLTCAQVASERGRMRYSMSAFTVIRDYAKLTLDGHSTEVMIVNSGLQKSSISKTVVPMVSSSV
jgi:hypothetical protein